MLSRSMFAGRRPGDSNKRGSLSRRGCDNLLISQPVMKSTTDVQDKARDPARSRRAILDAAEHLFAERGYEAATMAEIAAAAGLSRGTPAYFFRSKEDLYRAVLGRAFEETAELIRSAEFEAVGFEDAMTKAIGRYLDFLATRPNFVRLVVRDCLDGGRFLQRLPEHLAAIGEAISAVDDGRMLLRADVDPRHLLLSGISLCWFPMVARPLTTDLGFEPESRAFADERKKQVIELLLHGALTG